MVKYSVKDGSRGGSGGDRVAGRGGIGGGGEGNIDVKSAAVVTIFCSLFLCTSGPLRATVSSTVFTGSWKKEEESFTFVMVLYIGCLDHKLGLCRHQSVNQLWQQMPEIL